MNTFVRLIDNETGGLVPIRSELSVVDGMLQIKCNGDYGFIIQVNLDDVLIVMNDDLHG